MTAPARPTTTTLDAARLEFEIHWSVCRAQRAGRFCQRCDDLDRTADDHAGRATR